MPDTKNLCLDANPVNTATGNKIHSEVDYRVLGTSGLRFERFYNGDRTTPRAWIGTRWRHTYDRMLTSGTSGPGKFSQRPDGQIHLFTQVDSVTYLSSSLIGERLTRLVGEFGATSGWVLETNNDDEIENYDANGRLISIASRQGLVTTLTYSTAATPADIAPSPDLLIEVSDPFGRKLHFVYDIEGRVQKITDPAVNRVPQTGDAFYGYAYDAAGNLTAVTYPDGRTKQYHYSEPGLITGNVQSAMTGITDENDDRFASYSYDIEGRVISSEHAGGALRTEFSYDASGATQVTNYVSATATSSRTKSFTTIATVAKNTEITGDHFPGCGPKSRSFDATGLPTSGVDWNGNRTDYTYDAASGLETVRTEGLTAGGVATAESRTTSTQWDPNFRLPAVIAEPLRKTTNAYDPDGTLCGARGALCSRTIQATTDANGSQAFGATTTGAPRTWTYTYNSNGSVLTINGPRTGVNDVTTYTYYPNDDADLGKRGNVASVTNAAGHVTSITAYDAHGQPLTIIDPNGITTTLAYDVRQRLTSRTVDAETTSYEYDGVGQLTKVTLPDGSFLTYSYDAAHRMTAIEDNLGNRIAYTLDAMGNRTAEEVRDPANNLAQTRSRVFNNLNRLFREIGAASQVTEYAYDNQGNVTSVKDPVEKVTANEYDALNRLRRVIDPALGVTKYDYNGLDALTQVTDPRDLVTGYTVDGLGNLTLQQSPDTGNTSNTYDEAGNLLTQTDAKGQTTGYAYDALNRVTLITFHDGSKHAYAYDQGLNGVGRLSSITETDPGNAVTSVIAYAYDTHGRVTSETRTLGGQSYVTAYGYDAAGRMNGMTYPSGRTLAYGFDALGRINQLTTTKNGQTQVVVQSVAYHPFGGVTGLTFGNGQAYTRSVDQDGRIASYSLGAQSYGIGYDAASRISFISDLGNPANSNTYGYDSLDRLTSAVLPSTNYAYSYDPVGNRLLKTVGASTDAYAYSPTSNRIASVTPGSGPFRSFSFDANGSTLADGLNTYTYDARGRMVQAVSSLGTTSYQVNALGQRVRKTNSQADTIFHYDARGRLIAESGPGGSVKRELIYLGDIPVGVVQ